MKIRIIWIGSLLLVFGVTTSVFSYLNLYTWETELHDNACVVIGPHLSNKLSYWHWIKSTKQVEVYVIHGPIGVDSLWGASSWASLRGTQIELLTDGGLNNISVTSNQDSWINVVFDVPTTWKTIRGVRVTNPADAPVAVIITALHHNQLLNNTLWRTLILGIASVAVGIVLTGYGFRKNRTHRTRNA